MSDIPAIDAWCNAFDERGIEIPYPVQELRLQSGESSAAARRAIEHELLQPKDDE